MDADSNTLRNGEDRLPVLLPSREPPRPSQTYRVQGRFGMGAIMLGVTLFSLIVAAPVALGADKRFVAIIVGIVVSFLLLVGLAQIFLFRGRRPRVASVLTGACVLSLVWGAFFWIQLVRSFGGFPRTFDLFLNVLLSFAFAAVWGAFFGYLAGGLLAGIFLVLDYFDSWLTGKPRRGGIEAAGTDGDALVFPGLPESFLTKSEPEAPGYRVTKRFGMGAIALGMTLFSILVAGLVRYDVAGPRIAGAVLYFIGVAFGQAFLFGGERPRKASVYGGAIAGGVLVMLHYLISDDSNSPGGVAKIALLVALALWGGILGALFGYLAGGLLAGIFLILDYFDCWLTGKARSMPGEEEG